jgi:hypothetical protein
MGQVALFHEGSGQRVCSSSSFPTTRSACSTRYIRKSRVLRVRAAGSFFQLNCQRSGQFHTLKNLIKSFPIKDIAQLIRN